ncbi:MAG: helix-hairpin-helix domain-containing protein [Proteobacteria bacterium]|nr:helix-hairpin-helix domain-containing protein [Pseudomonadota bacterium]MBU1738422.1 helix-hairpin-helix domain-containing protein [Pseudomonadota bacterium]
MNDRCRFLILVLSALLIVVVKIPGAGDAALVSNNKSVFADFTPIRLSNGQLDRMFYAVDFAAREVASSPCISPRAAILGLEPFDLNQADRDTLSFIRGIGPKLAARIVARREWVGGFNSYADLLEVRGVGSTKLKFLQDATVICR